MSKRIAALQRQLSASQSTAMQAQFAHEEFKVSADCSPYLLHPQDSFYIQKTSWRH